MITAARQIHRIDATDRILGRLATEVAILLRGKQQLGFTNHPDHGDIVVVLNPAKIRVTGHKLADKKYYRHSSYPGALRERRLDEMLATQPETVIRLAVKNMLPKNRLSQSWLKRLQFEVTDGQQ